MTRHASILSTIGNTPVIRLNHIAPEITNRGVEIYVKAESFNPGGSVKDRLALGIIEAAERDGSLKPGQTVVEATSGNTGIGLAMVCAAKGYPLVVTMAESFSVERRKLMRMLGAKVILTPAAEKGSGMLAKARELADKHGWFLARQFENEAGPDIHSATTAREILAAFPDGLDYWITGAGTGGTLKGVARVLKAESPRTKVIAIEPDNSPLIGSGVAQSYLADGSPAASHPAFRPHVMQGVTPDFIPRLVADVLRERWLDDLRPVSGDAALATARALATKEGMLCGITAGATVAAAIELAKTAPKGSRLLAMLPDTGERYLSTPLFAGIAEAMDDEEKAIAASTPRFRFDAPPAAPAAAQAPAAPSAKAVAEVEALVADPANPVVLFALEWCEFCWSVRKLFAAAGIRYRAVDLDSAVYRENDRGGELRRALAQMTGAVTIPQIFIGGRHIGGASETFDAFNDGTLRRLLEKHGQSIDEGSVGNAYGFLPAWLHPRGPAAAPKAA
jgi:cysteine synthase A